MTTFSRTISRRAVRDDGVVDFTASSSRLREPMLAAARYPDISLAGWMASHRDPVEEALLTHGAILFRGFTERSAEDFAALGELIAGRLSAYTERAAPRREVAQKVYTSTEYPRDQAIPLHHEMSYCHQWPRLIVFFCETPSAVGGSTPVVDDRGVLPLIDPTIRRRFAEQGVMYVRNFGHGVDLGWEEAFQTSDRATVEEYCRSSGITCEWFDDGSLRTRQVRQAMVRHPRTGDLVWFNHAHLFHSSNLAPAVRDSLLSEFAPDRLPRNAFYGDGSPIDDAVLDDIRAAYQARATRFTWTPGDVLVLDNVLCSHGRDPYEGARRILVAMSELIALPAANGDTSEAP